MGSSNIATLGDSTIMVGGAFVSVSVADEEIPANYEGIINIEVNKI